MISINDRGILIFATDSRDISQSWYFNNPLKYHFNTLPLSFTVVSDHPKVGEFFLYYCLQFSMVPASMPTTSGPMPHRAGGVVRPQLELLSSLF
jgi:hypothetical protein